MNNYEYKELFSLAKSLKVADTKDNPYLTGLSDAADTFINKLNQMHTVKKIPALFLPKENSHVSSQKQEK